MSGYDGLGGRTVAATIAIAGVPASGVLVRVMAIAFGGRIARHQVGLAIAGLLVLASTALVIALIVAATLFGIWLHRAVRNLTGLGRVGMTYSPAAAVGSFYIPFVSVVRPYRVLTELWRASDPRPEADGSAWRTHGSNTSLLDTWWGCLLASGFVPQLKRLNPVVEIPGASSVFALTAIVLEVVAAIACFRLMQGIASRQEAIAARLARQSISDAQQWLEEESSRS
jgi:hypothetical protein